MQPLPDRAQKLSTCIRLLGACARPYLVGPFILPVYQWSDPCGLIRLVPDSLLWTPGVAIMWSDMRDTGDLAGVWSLFLVTWVQLGQIRVCVLGGTACAAAQGEGQMSWDKDPTTPPHRDHHTETRRCLQTLHHLGGWHPGSADMGI